MWMRAFCFFRQVTTSALAIRLMSKKALHKKSSAVFLCDPLRISAFSAVNGNFNAEGRRDTQRAAEKMHHFGLL